jgi:phosphoribosylformimino-5-aminoimidazole carboxamide ribotide isomerase
MEVFPAIDLRDGKVVRLMQGDYARQSTYADDPAKVADQFVGAGAGWIHVVDLDAARSGLRANAAAIRGICAAGARVELGGGIRDDQSVSAALELGVTRVIIGSAALKNWAWFTALVGRKDMAGKVVLGVDARDGKLAAHGWTEATDLDVMTVAEQARNLPLAAIVYTDIRRDGMLCGPDLATTQRIVAQTALPVIASGGMSSLDDVAACGKIGCAGVILGRSLYEGKIDLAEAIKVARTPGSQKA